jgi:TRAP-type C4-dicarboxylate transport system permease small subunit
MNIFGRINVEQWQHILSIVSLMLFLCTFIVILVFSMGMSRTKLNHMETLPLDSDPSDHE